MNLQIICILLSSKGFWEYTGTLFLISFWISKKKNNFFKFFSNFFQFFSIFSTCSPFVTPTFVSNFYWTSNEPRSKEEINKIKSVFLSLSNFFGSENSPISRIVSKKTSMFEDIFGYCLNPNNKELLQIYKKEKTLTKKLMIARLLHQRDKKIVIKNVEILEKQHKKII